MRLVSLLPLVIFAHSLLAENWPGWRGPRGDGTSLEKNVPTEWNPNKNIAWKTLTPVRAGMIKGDYHLFCIGK